MKRSRSLDSTDHDLCRKGPPIGFIPGTRIQFSPEMMSSSPNMLTVYLVPRIVLVSFIVVRLGSILFRYTVA